MSTLNSAPNVSVTHNVGAAMPGVYSSASNVVYNISESSPVTNPAYQKLQQRYLQQYIFIIFLIPFIAFISAFISISCVGGNVSYSSLWILILVSIIVMIMETFKIVVVVSLLITFVVLCLLVTLQMNLKPSRDESNSDVLTQNNGNDFDRDLVQRSSLGMRSARAIISRIASNLSCESLFIMPVMGRLEFYLKKNLFCTVAMVFILVVSVFVLTYLLLSTLILQLTAWLISDFNVGGFSDGMKVSFIMFLVNLGVLLWGTCVRLVCWKSNAPVNLNDNHASDMIQQLRQQFSPLVLSYGSEEEYPSDEEVDGNDSSKQY